MRQVITRFIATPLTVALMSLGTLPALAQEAPVVSPPAATETTPVMMPPPPSGSFAEPRFQPPPPPPSGNNQFGPPPEGQFFGPPPGSQFGPPPSGGQFGEPGGGAGNFGPSEKDMERMDKQREEQEKKMRARGLQQMQRGMKQFANMLARFTKRIVELEGKGVAVPADCKEQIAKATTLVESVINTTDPEFMDSFDPSELQSAGEALQECGPKIEQMAQLPRVVKQVKAQLTRLDKRYQSVVKRAAKAKLDLSEFLASIENGLNEIKAALGQVASAEDPFATLEELREKFDTIEQQIQSAEGIFQLQKAVKNLQGQARRLDTLVKRLEKKGEGVEERAKVNELKSVIQQLQGIKVTEDTIEELPGILQQAFDLVEELYEAFDLKSPAGPSPFEVPGGGKPALPQLNLPQLNKVLLEQSLLNRFLARGRERTRDQAQRMARIEQSRAQTQVAGVKIGVSEVK